MNLIGKQLAPRCHTLKEGVQAQRYENSIRRFVVGVVVVKVTVLNAFGKLVDNDLKEKAAQYEVSNRELSFSGVNFRNDAHRRDGKQKCAAESKEEFEILCFFSLNDQTNGPTQKRKEKQDEIKPEIQFLRSDNLTTPMTQRKHICPTKPKSNNQTQCSTGKNIKWEVNTNVNLCK